jgi:hypothetical protein
MIERCKRLDPVGQQLVQKPLVKIEALGIRCSRSFRKHTRPGDRKAIGFGSELPDELNVLLVTMVMIVRDVSGALIGYFALDANEAVPDRRAAAVFVDRALDLIGGRRCPPQEVRRKGGKPALGRFDRYA